MVDDSDDKYIIHINELNIKNFNIRMNRILFNGKNSICRSLKTVDNKRLIIVFDGIINKFNKLPRSKNLVRINNETFELFKHLLLKINNNINGNILYKDFLYESNNKYVIIRLPGTIKDNNLKIFTKFYEYKNNNYIPINIKDIPNNFAGTFTIEIRGVLYNHYNNKNEKLLVSDFNEIVINKRFNIIKPISDKFRNSNYLN